MRERMSQSDALLPLTASLWLGYLMALLAIDLTFYPRPIFPPWYYLINGASAAIMLALALWARGRMWTAPLLLPAAIILLSVVPVLLAQWVSMRQPPGPGVGPGGSPEALLLRVMPLLFMALVLTAWQYGWRYVVLFSVGIAMFTLGLHLYFFRPGGPSLVPNITLVAIQTVSFLIVGYFISTLMARLKRQQVSLAQANARLVDFAATLEDLTVSRERNRMARELHDTLAHTLSALAVQLETTRAYWEVDPPAARRMLDDSLAATRSGLHETRRALKSLRASPLEDLGLALALRQLADEAAARAHLQLSTAILEQLPALAPSVEQCIYRVAQEAIANVVHHANARLLTVQLTNGTAIVLRVADDGRGFVADAAVPAGHFGLTGMAERTRLIGADLTITSRPGAGTEVLLRVRNPNSESEVPNDEGADLR